MTNKNKRERDKREPNLCNDNHHQGTLLRSQETPSSAAYQYLLNNKLTSERLSSKHTATTTKTIAMTTNTTTTLPRLNKWTWRRRRRVDTFFRRKKADDQVSEMMVTTNSNSSLLVLSETQSSSITSMQESMATMMTNPRCVTKRSMANKSKSRKTRFSLPSIHMIACGCLIILFAIIHLGIAFRQQDLFGANQNQMSKYIAHRFSFPFLATSRPIWRHFRAWPPLKWPFFKIGISNGEDEGEKQKRERGESTA